MRIIFTGCLTLILLIGCSSSTPYRVLDEEQQLIPTTIIDRRPAEHVKGGLPLSTPTYTIPARRFDPPLPELLGHRLFKEFGPAISQKEIVVTRFLVQNYFGASYRNAQAASAGAVMAGGNYSVASVLASVKSGDVIDAVFAEIEGTIDGVRFTGQGAVEYSGKPPNPVYMGMVYDVPAAREATRISIQQALDAAMTSIREH